MDIKTNQIGDLLRDQIKKENQKLLCILILMEKEQEWVKWILE